ncbi:monocyte differentiation antigen CD14 [Eublepharis macularius]|uniref:Monocyte differentiation antigen CD14 n=1 Tax=Eublepharis macularius TaxID=481883 RepID=A0AA97L421_EUBMA|nr:monocyte differentiation antigen CD14 [Eublepharis macularius]
MCRTQAFVSLLLLGLKLPEAKSDCEFVESENLCVCSLLKESQMDNLFECFQATTYELRGGNLEKFAIFSDLTPSPYVLDILTALHVRKLVFTDLLVPEVILPGALEFASHPPLLSEIEFVNCTFLRRAGWSYPRRLSPLNVSSLRFHRVTADSLADRRNDLSSLTRWLETLENLTLTDSKVTSIPCKIGQMFTGLHRLDVSGNHFQDGSMRSSLCQGAFPGLQELRLHHNRLTSYDAVCETVVPLNMLMHLDLSQNDFPPGFSSSSQCTWPQSLRVLNLSSTGLKHVEWSLPPNMEILDLSGNSISTLDLSLPALKELHLSNNRLQTVPSVKKLPRLEVLSVDRNQISHLPSQSLLQLKHLQLLKASHNLYDCSCPYIKELQDLASKPSLLASWPHNYTCQTPPSYRDSLVKDMSPSTLQCNKAPLLQGSAVILLSSLHLLLCLFLI